MTQPIQRGEFQRRISQLQKEMHNVGFEALLIYGWKRGHIRYLSGYHPNYIANVAMLVLPREGPPALRIRFPFDLERAQRQSWMEDIAASGDLLGLADDSASVLEGLGLARGRIGLVTGDKVIDEMPFSVYQRLERSLPKAEFAFASELLLDARALKSAAEFSLLRQSARIADAGARAAQALMEPGKVEYEVIASAEAEARRMGAGAHLAVIASRGEQELIRPPEERALEEGDNVIFEIAVEKHGYWTQVARVFYVGGATDEQRRIFTATHEAYQAAVEACRPGRSCEQVAAAARAALEDADLAEYLEVDLGHGIGLDLPEPPRVEPGDQTVLRPGSVLVIHPSVRVPGVGGAFLGGTVLVHDGAPEPLHEIPSAPPTGES
jgi:Xaa-Pro dipeptidase